MGSAKNNPKKPNKNPNAVKRALDIFVTMANVNLIGAHFFGSVASLGLLNWVEE
jgi:hypothetical protein